MTETGLVGTNGTRLFHAVENADRPDLPWLVFSNSLLTDLALWDGQMPAALGRFRILRYDQRGHGQSEIPQVAASCEVLGADLIGLLDARGISRCSFVGLSMGVPTALAAFEIDPDRFERLVLSDGQFRSPPNGAEFWDERIELARTLGMAELATVTAARWLTPAIADDRRSALEAMISATPLEGFVNCAEALKTFDFAPTLARIKCPVQLIAGAQDGTMPETMRASMAGILDVRMAVIEGAGHVPNYEQPDAFNAVLDAFLVA